MRGAHAGPGFGPVRRAQFPRRVGVAAPRNRQRVRQDVVAHPVIAAQHGLAVAEGTGFRHRQWPTICDSTENAAPVCDCSSRMVSSEKVHIMLTTAILSHASFFSTAW